MNSDDCHKERDLIEQQYDMLEEEHNKLQENFDHYRGMYAHLIKEFDRVNTENDILRKSCKEFIGEINISLTR